MTRTDNSKRKRKTDSEGPSADNHVKTNKKVKQSDDKPEPKQKDPKAGIDNKKGKQKFDEAKSGKENKKTKILDAKKADKKDSLKKGIKQAGGVKEKKPEIPKDKKGQRELQKKLKAERKKKKAGGGESDDKNHVFELGVQAKQVWEKVRSHQTSKEEKEKLIPELHGLLKGKVEKVIRAHDTVRVIEFLMAEGTPEIREALFQELKEQVVELSKSKYAAFFVQKLLNYGTKEQKAHILKSFEGKVADMTKHKVANAVIENCYNEVATAPQRNRYSV